MDAAAIADLVRHAVPDAAIDILPSIDMPTLGVDRDHVVDVCRVLRDHPELQFAFLADVTAVDRWPAEPRFEVVYHMACVGPHYVVPGAGAAAPARRLRVKVGLSGAEPRVPSVVSVWPTAGWPERETFDLFGIIFEAHPDLRRVLMPEDWEGHPLRKDYNVQIRKDAAAWSPLQLTPEEFARNVRAQHDKAVKQAEPERPAGRSGD
jgi:NADH-quinone oxidoreductase subunit C